jgi:hypothetical protein
MFNFRFLDLVILVISLAACGSLPSSLPMEVVSSQAVIRLETEGKIVVQQSFRNKRDKCEEVRDALAVSIRRFDAGSLATITTCHEQTGIIVTQTHSVQPVGEYSFTLARNRRRLSPSPAKISLLYKNADFHSSEDAMSAGAQILEANQKVTGDVSYQSGDQTDWIRLKGKNTAASLVLVTSSVGLDADVFRTTPGGQGTQRIGSLFLNRPKIFQVAADDILVRLRAKEGESTLPYTLIRRDSEGSKKAKVQVVDCYPVGAGMGVAILKVGEGVQVNDGVVISASDASGKRHSLGKCRITSIEGADASCRLPYSESAQWVDFRVENVLAGEQV